MTPSKAGVGEWLILRRPTRSAVVRFATHSHPPKTGATPERDLAYPCLRVGLVIRRVLANGHGRPYNIRR